MLKKTNPQKILNLIQLFRFGLISGFISKEEVLKWAETIIDREDNPDLFFVDLFMMSLKSEKEIGSYLSEYLNHEELPTTGRPLLGIIYKKFASKEFSLSFIAKRLLMLKEEAIFTKSEIDTIYSIYIDYDIACDNIQHMQDVETGLAEFLEAYKDYTLENYSYWKRLDEKIDSNLK